MAPFRHIVFPRNAPRHPGLVDSDIRDVRATRHDRDGSALTPEQFAFVRRFFEQRGLAADAYRTETLGRRLSACLRLLRVEGLPEAR
jgi:hypothetical protein